MNLLLLTAALLLTPTTSTTHPADIRALRHLVDSLHPDSITPGSCLSSWNFSIDPCDSIFTDRFTCGLRCDLIVFGSYRVTDLSLDQAGYSGSLAPFYMPYLQTLDLADNSLSGPIPASLSNLTFLCRLSLSGNSFTGSIPHELGFLSRLRELYLDSNRLTGSIPASFNLLVSLERLELQRNGLSGEIPDLSQLRNLGFLDLSDNLISGKAPTNLPLSLVEISLRNNSLRGQLEINVPELRFLQVLDLSYNDLNGTVPASLFQHRSLQQMTVSHNRFAFLQPPSDNFSTSGLVAVDLSYNELSGMLPPFMARMPELSALSLEHNRLTGKILSEYAEKAVAPIPGTVSFKRLLLGGNYLFGLIPGRFIGLKPGSINVSLVDNCLYMCSEAFFFCKGGDQKSWADCKRFRPTNEAH